MKSSRPRLARRVGIGVAAASVVAGALAWQAAPSGATQTVHEIDFGSNGPTPSSVTINSGDSILFKNDVDQTASMPVLGTVGGTVSDVTITISGATQKPFVLARGQEATVGSYQTGNRPLVVKYSADYDSTRAAGILPGPKQATGGTIVVQPSRIGPPGHGPGPGPDALPAGASTG